MIEKLEIENVIFAQITKTTRKERQRVNMVALREAVINAIVHNDYSLEVPPVVEIFSDRITVTSYGGLLPDMSQEDFFKGLSMPRNRELMRVFKDVELVEQLGSGMERIMEVYNQSIFEFRPNFLIVTFPFDSDDGNTRTADVPVNVGVNETANRILAAISQSSSITTKQIADTLSVSTKTVQREIKKLKDSGKLCRIGSDKSGHWEIVE